MAVKAHVADSAGTLQRRSLASILAGRPFTGQLLLACKAAEGRAIVSARLVCAAPDDALDCGINHDSERLYLAETTFLDGVDAYNRHVMVLRDGTMRGGSGFYYTVGSYTCSSSKWKGEMTSREHSPISVMTFRETPSPHSPECFCSSRAENQDHKIVGIAALFAYEVI
jgi:hypothetical protein